MFTTGSKLLLGATVLSVVGAIAFGVTTGGPAGVLGTIGLVSLASVFGFLAGINLYTRDGNVAALEPGVERTSAAAQPPVGRSLWPIVGAVGVGGLAVGAVSQPVVFKVSLIVVLATVVEWMIQGWSERASADRAYNEGIRRRLLHPLEFPIVGALIGAAVVYAFSRIMLSISKDAGRWVFIILGTIIVAIGFLFAAKRGLSKGTAAGIVAVGALALVGVGVASAVSGQRTIEEHPHISTAVCLGTATEAETEEIDDKASQDVAAKSNVISNVELTEDGRLVAFNLGTADTEYHEITVPRSTTVHVLFTNKTEEPRRLTVHLGTFPAADGTAGSEQADCTTAVNQDGVAFLTFRLDKSQAASTTPYRLTVPGVEGQEISLVVP
ncbi:MAG: hypothetical protein HY828_09965 [Actinobacteria bacterium]|nr:hypothetical protein [Actinomycetota bacterium]